MKDTNSPILEAIPGGIRARRRTRTARVAPILLATLFAGGNSWADEEADQQLRKAADLIWNAASVEAGDRTIAAFPPLYLGDKIKSGDRRPYATRACELLLEELLDRAPRGLSVVSGNRLSNELDRFFWNAQSYADPESAGTLARDIGAGYVIAGELREKKKGRARSYILDLYAFVPGRQPDRVASIEFDSARTGRTLYRSIIDNKRSHADVPFGHTEKARPVVPPDPEEVLSFKMRMLLESLGKRVRADVDGWPSDLSRVALMPVWENGTEHLTAFSREAQYALAGVFGASLGPRELDRRLKTDDFRRSVSSYALDPIDDHVLRHPRVNVEAVLRATYIHKPGAGKVHLDLSWRRAGEPAPSVHVRGALDDSRFEAYLEGLCTRPPDGDYAFAPYPFDPRQELNLAVAAAMEALVRDVKVRAPEVFAPERVVAIAPIAIPGVESWNQRFFHYQSQLEEERFRIEELAIGDGVDPREALRSVEYPAHLEGRKFECFAAAERKICQEMFVELDTHPLSGEQRSIAKFAQNHLAEMRLLGRGQLLLSDSQRAQQNRHGLRPGRRLGADKIRTVRQPDPEVILSSELLKVGERSVQVAAFVIDQSMPYSQDFQEIRTLSGKVAAGILELFGEARSANPLGFSKDLPDNATGASEAEDTPVPLFKIWLVPAVTQGDAEEVIAGLAVSDGARRLEIAPTIRLEDPKADISPNLGTGCYCEVRYRVGDNLGKQAAEAVLNVLLSVAPDSKESDLHELIGSTNPVVRGVSKLNSSWIADPPREGLVPIVIVMDV